MLNQTQQSLNRQKRKRKARIRLTNLILIIVGFVMCSYLGLFSLFFVGRNDGPLSASSSSSVADYNFINNPQQLRYPISNKPRLDQIIQGWNITGNVSWLLDFAIVGFPKTGTSTLMFYLQNHTDLIYTFGDERCEIGWNQHVPLLKELYPHYHPQRKMGIKCPNNLEVDIALANYNQFFPKTKFIIGLRNPVTWFESFYNFRITNEFEMPTQPRKLIGKCKRFNWGVCTDRANFSNHLSKIEPWRNIFIYDVAQLQDSNTSRAKQFLQDLGEFLELQQPLTKPMIWIKPGQKPSSPQRAKELEAMKINLCHDDKFKPVRDRLQQHASESAKFLVESFLQNPHVYASSREYFTTLINKWHVDACEVK